jgi:peptidoglycan/xylan/chitin deacetylase (PgdA/CDA1 family)
VVLAALLCSGHASSCFAQWWPFQRGRQAEEVQVEVEPAPRPAAKKRRPLAVRDRATSRGAETDIPDTAPLALEAFVPPAAPPPIEARDGRAAIVWGGGEPLEKVARACGTTADSVLADNRLTHGQMRAGQVLSVPAPSWLNTPDRPDGAPSAFDPAVQAAREVWRGVRGRRQVALTFDAGWSPAGARELTAVLRRVDAKGTFFVTGDFARKYRALVRHFAESGFPVHNHSWSHPEFTKLGDEQIADELGRTDMAVRAVTGKPSLPFFRPPFGDRDPRVLRAAAGAGFRPVYWTLDSLDSLDEKPGADFLVERVLNPPQANGDPDSFLDGAIVLMHVGEPATVEALPRIIAGLRQRGFKFVTVDEIVKP